MITATNGDAEIRGRGDAETGGWGDGVTGGRGDAGTRRAPFELDFFFLLVFVVIFFLAIAVSTYISCHPKRGAAKTQSRKRRLINMVRDGSCHFVDRRCGTRRYNPLNHTKQH